LSRPGAPGDIREQDSTQLWRLGSAGATTAPEQNARLDFDDLRLALAKLSPDQREAVLLIGAEGFSYEEAAQICGTAVGTIKSRVNRARRRLSELMSLEMDEIGPDRLTRAALFAA